MCNRCDTKGVGFLGLGGREVCACYCNNVQISQQHLGADERGRDRGTRAVGICGECKHRVRLGR